jgi:hypothetical protein
MCLAALAARTAQADTYTVATTADPSITACPSATTSCSLRQLILYVEAHPFPPDTIVLPPGTYTLEHGQLLIEGSMSIVGPGAQSTVIQEPVPTDREAAGDRVFDIEGVSEGLTPIVSISAVEVAGGDASANPVDQFSGGDIRNTGVLTLTEDWITNGFACSGGGIGNEAGTLTIDRSLISGNHSACGGADSGGIENYGIPASSGTPNLPGHLTIEDSTVADNDARLVGGVYSWNDPDNTMTIANSTIANNSSQDEPSGAARGPGGGLGVGEGAVRIQNSILADNVEIAAGVTTPTNCAPGPGLTSLGGNIDSGTDCGLSDTVPGQADQSETNPLLGQLQNNGGPTMTMALLPASPALDKVPAAGADCPVTDQRGVSRPQGPACDIGAFELAVASTKPPTGGSTTTATTKASGPTCTLSVNETKVRFPKRRPHKSKSPPSGVLTLTASCNEALQATLAGTLTELVVSRTSHHKRRTKSLKLSPVRASLPANSARKLVVSIPKRALTALTHGTQESVLFTLRAGSATASAKIARLRI